MKPYQIILFGVLASLTAISIDALVPGLEAISRSIGEDSGDISLTISVFLLGAAGGEFFAGPLSDAYGRKKILLLALAAFVSASAACVMATDMTTLAILRIFQAMGAGAASVLTILLISDRFNINDTARFLSLTLIVTMGIRVGAPISGYQISNHFGWQSIFWCFVVIGLLLLVYFYSSSNHPERTSERKSFTISAALGDFRNVLADRQSQYYIGAEIATSIGLFTYVSTATTVMVRHLGIQEANFSFLFAAGTALMMCGAWLNKYWVARLGLNRMMLIACLGMILVSLVLLAIGLTKTQHNMLTASMILLFFLPLIIVRINANTGCVKRFPQSAGAASSLLNALGLASGAAAGMVCASVFHATPLALISMFWLSTIICLLCTLGLIGLAKATRAEGYTS